MGFWDNHEENYQKVYENDQFEEHKGSLGHEVLAGGAAFAGFKAFEDHQRAEGTSSSRIPSHHQLVTDKSTPGKPVSHAFAKELLAGFGT